MSLINKDKWDWEVNSETNYWGWRMDEIWSYRHLLTSLVRRDFLLNYQQTILGPVWILFQPLMTLVTYVLVFGKVVGISTGSIPPGLFYFSGIVLWGFFSDCFSGTSNTFRDNIHIFNKVYFPRLIIPISVISTNFLRFLIQLLLLFILIVYYYLFENLSLSFNACFFAFPLIIIFIGTIGLGLGLFFSVFTAKYRDMSNLVALGTRLLMFVTPVIYPVAAVPEKVRWIVQLNPLTPLFEAFRFGLLGEGTFTVVGLIYSFLFTTVIILSSMVIFNKQGDKLIDVV